MENNAKNPASSILYKKVTVEPLVSDQPKCKETGSPKRGGQSTRGLKYINLTENPENFGIMESGRLREVVAYERWSLMRGGRLREAVA